MTSARWIIVLLLLLLALSGAGVAWAASPASAGTAPAAAVQPATATLDVTPVPSSTTGLTPTRPHPVAVVLSDTLHIPYTQVMALHNSGIGFGVIARAYLTAQYSDGQLTFEQTLALFQSGMGWGQIAKEYGVHPGGKGLGSIMGHPPKDKDKPKGSLPDPDDADKCPGNSCKAPGHKPDKTKNKP